jgi:hypothetical protein
MDDNGNIAYYLVLGAIYLLSRIFGKKKKKPGQPQPAKERNVAPPTAENEGEEPISFEDILRELSGAKTPKPVSEPLPLPILEYEPELELEGVPEAIQPGSYSVDEIDQIAVDYDVPDPIGYNKYSSSSQPIKRKVLTFERTENFEIKQKVSIDYLEDLYDENGPAKAFVMSEIFARKY